MIFFFGILTSMILQREKNIILNIYKEKSLQASEIIADDITNVMLEKDPRKVMQDIRAFNRPEEIKVGVLGPNGLPAFNTDISVPKNIFDDQKESHIIAGNELFFFKPLNNEVRCHGCHDLENKTRGMVVVRTSLKNAYADINETGRRLISFAFIIGLISEMFLIVFLRRMILKPIEVLNEGAEILKSGRLDYRINLKRDDEIGTLVSCFNDMAESIERSHANLENAVRGRTKELRVIADLSLEVFKGNLAIKEIIDQFLEAIILKLDYNYAALCLIDKETGLLMQEFKKGIARDLCPADVFLDGDHPFAKAAREIKPVIKKSADIGGPEKYGHIAVVPVLSHQRKRCRDINLCNLEQCPAFNSPDERCWLINATLCRSPQAVAGKEKIYGCLHCVAFPVMGILIAGKKDAIAKTSLHSLEILSSEIASAIENQRFIGEKKDDIQKITKLHDISIEALQNLNMTELKKSIVLYATTFAQADAAILWFMGEDKRLYFEAASNIDNDLIPKILPVAESFAGSSILEECPIETIQVNDIKCLGSIIEKYSFLYAVSIPLKHKWSVLGCLTLFKNKDFYMTDSEKAIIQLFTSQAAAAINTARLYEELVERERSFRTLAENLPGAVYRVHMRENNNMQFFNNMIQTMTGFSIEELEGGEICSIEPLILPEDRLHVMSRVKRAVIDNQPFQVEYRLQRKDGEIRYFLERGRPIKGTDGTPYFIDGVIFDITDRKQAEDDLKRLMISLEAEKEFSEAVFNNMAMGVMVIDKDNIITKLNPAGFEMLRVNSDIIGKELKDVLPDASDFLTVKEDLSREVSIVDESVAIPIGFNNSIILDENNEKTGVVVVFRDLTEIKKLQAEVRKKLHFEAMGKVIAGVAHEIRNPLFGISSIVQILDREIKSEQHNALLKAMLNEIHRLKNLIEELLLYSRPSKLNITRIDLNRLIEKTILYIKAKKDNITLNLKIPHEARIMADMDKLTQVLLNLVDNAVGAGCKIVSITTEEKGDVVIMTIEDDGIGIKKENIERIFDPFFTTKKEGTGLGLSICKKLVEDHNGTIEVWSTEGSGAVFVLTFPNQAI